MAQGVFSALAKIGENKWVERFIFVVGLIVIVNFLYQHYDSGCNVAYLELRGGVATYVPPEATSTDITGSDVLTAQIREAADNSSIKAIVLEVDSPGGDAVAGEEIATALKDSHKPTVALIRSEGDSAAYLAASGADAIFASSFSGVGDIGITASYSDYSKQDQQQGITYHQLSIGEYKDMFDQSKPLTPAEQQLEMQQLQVYYDHLLEVIAANRKMDIAQLTPLANGEVYTGEQALKNGLITHLGGLEDVKTYLSKQIGREIEICDLK